jgi:hypothetical protein
MGKCEIMWQSDVLEEGDKWQAVVNTVMNLWDP